ncbi:MAG: nucleoside-diphosphate kinase [Candidatus Wallbacteria bacterium]
MEKTFVMVKPDGVDKRLIGEVISRIEKKGLKIAGLKMMQLNEEFVRKHYAEHVSKPFFPVLLRFTTCGPVVAMVIEGPNAISNMRHMAGNTYPEKAEPGTIRNDYALFVTYNIVHCSDSPESAEREIKLFFNENEIFDYKTSLEKWNAVLPA